MLKRLVFSAALVGGVALSSAALANGVYVSGSVGAIIPPFRQTGSTTTPVAGINFPTDTQMNFKNALDAEAAVGYRLDLNNGSAIRIEVAAQYAQYDVSDYRLSLNDAALKLAASGQAVTLNGLRVRQGEAMISATYQLPRLVAGISPFIGVGSGYVYQLEDAGQMKLTTTVTINGASSTTSQTLNIPADTGRSPVYMFQAGLAIPVGKKVSVTPAYRYTSTYDGKQHWQEGRVGVRYDV